MAPYATTVTVRFSLFSFIFFFSFFFFCGVLFFVRGVWGMCGCLPARVRTRVCVCSYLYPVIMIIWWSIRSSSYLSAYVVELLQRF